MAPSKAIPLGAVCLGCAAFVQAVGVALSVQRLKHATEGLGAAEPDQLKDAIGQVTGDLADAYHPAMIAGGMAIPLFLFGAGLLIHASVGMARKLESP